MKAIEQALTALRELDRKERKMVKLRAVLLRTVDEINQILNDGKKRGRKAPRKNQKPRKPRKVRAQPTPIKNWPKLKPSAIAVPGFDRNYFFVKGLGVISLKKKDKPRLLALGANSCWGLTKKDGTVVFMGREALAKKLKLPAEELQI